MYGALLTALTESAERVIAAALATAPMPAPEWPPQTVLGHLADVDEQVWHARVRIMLDAQRAGDPAPTFPSWEPDATTTHARYGDLPVSEAAALLRASRARLVHELSTLSEHEWLAPARHAVWGAVDLPALLDHALEHDDEHTPR